MLLVHFAPVPSYFGYCLAIAILSDYFDGVLARRLGVATPTLRRLDSVVDTCFYGTAVYAAWILHPEAIHKFWWPIAILFILELLRYGFDFIKFHREASYHMYSSKLWGLSLFIAFFALLVYGISGWIFATAIYLGILSDLEGLTISAILPTWTHDVTSIFKAIEIRNGMLKHDSTESQK